MKTSLKLFIAFDIALVMVIGVWWMLSMRTADAPDVVLLQESQDSPATTSGNYVGSLYEGNYVWGGAMNLAWNELSDEIIGEPLQLVSEDATVQEIVSAFNERPFTASDLDEESYYVTAGYGQETVDRINKESREKFPSKSFGDLSMQLDPTDIISYAYFLKEVEYDETFEPTDMLFNGELVRALEANTDKQREGVEVLAYENNDQFIVSLDLKDNSDELILAKGYDMSSPDEVVGALRELEIRDESLPGLTEDESFMVPMLSLDMRRDYVELVGQSIANQGFESYFIAQMFENIKFDMDEAGARVENEAVIVVTLESALLTPAPARAFIFNEPYWIIMKRADSQNPYFLLGVSNTALMEVVE